MTCEMVSKALSSEVLCASTILDERGGQVKCVALPGTGMALDPCAAIKPACREQIIYLFTFKRAHNISNNVTC